MIMVKISYKYCIIKHEFLIIDLFVYNLLIIDKMYISYL